MRKDILAKSQRFEEICGESKLGRQFKFQNLAAVQRISQILSGCGNSRTNWANVSGKQANVM
jgi:hypothetical protein